MELLRLYNVIFQSLNIIMVWLAVPHAYAQNLIKAYVQKKRKDYADYVCVG